ncbi:MAG: hypothetical protein IJ012_00575, partial [Clostridia bacterium]|nr:hypothetical protein [Clostridia bacterium]
MANSTSLTATYESLPKIVKILIQLILGAIVGGIYRILRYLETKNVVTLVVGILCLIPPVSFISWVVDLITELVHNKITVLAD